VPSTALQAWMFIENAETFSGAAPQRPFSVCIVKHRIGSGVTQSNPLLVGALGRGLRKKGARVARRLPMRLPLARHTRHLGTACGGQRDEKVEGTSGAAGL
jgi:hypothetical protein